MREESKRYCARRRNEIKRDILILRQNIRRGKMEEQHGNREIRKLEKCRNPRITGSSLRQTGKLQR